ncbi:chemotaxis protein CheW [Paraburkholderia sp.]|uniref:chemotaxis protein CheW n=1 Tax=Paraburkholderia sp. TaxID=1926495 RepID=UPI002398B6BF|nr:chemotaxis protein CheW [Paraburkholderia sp.]MDE1180578.1 chemotaxis protein CheW [Paraburkholderia sp.]
MRCLNCPVFETAAAKLLERPIPDVQLPRHEIAPSRHLRPEGQGATESFVVFRIDDEWLALPTHVLQRIVPVRPIHTLPHRKHRAVLGIVNVQGEVLVCLSLALLLGFEPAKRNRATRMTGTTGAVSPRLLVVARGDEHAVLPVRQVDGVHRLAIAGFQPPPATLSETAARRTRAIAPGAASRSACSTPTACSTP